jgi:hypothetical protein
MSYIGKLKACCEQAGRAQDDSKRIARGWATDRTVRAKVDANLRTQGLDADSIMAASFVDGIDELAAIEKLLASAELRRNMALRELERHRLGRALRQASDQIIEGEAPLVPTPAPPRM